MYPYKLNNFIPELKEILSESQKHLGNMNCIYCLHVHSFTILFFVLDQCQICDANGGAAQESITHMYTDFIKNKLLPELTLLATKYATWWTFKPDSLLKSYLDDREINLDKYFRPQELLKHVLNVLKKETQFSNNNVIVLMDEEQQRVFDSWFIFVPDIILTHLLTHVTTASSEIADSLQNKHMIADFYIDSPTDIIYKDPSSVFWLTPVVDFAINESTGNVYSWKKLLFIFSDFCLNNKHFFTRHSETIIGINDNTSITNLFDFRYFHISQIENILKQITKFLGRKNNMIKNCHFLKHNQSFKVASNNKYTNVFNFIDDVINNNNDLMPHILSGLSI
jgi:hypothetical protein